MSLFPGHLGIACELLDRVELADDQQGFRREAALVARNRVLRLHRVDEPAPRMIKTADVFDAVTLAPERAAIAAALREYCKLDTYAMWKIWRVLREKVS